MRTITLWILLISSLAVAGVQNGGFEVWKDEKSLEGWMIQESGFEKTGDAYKGKSAAKLFNWYEHLPGSLETGLETKDSLIPGFPFAEAPAALNGFYKYVGKPEVCKTATAAVVFYKASDQDPKHYDAIAKISKDLPVTDQYTRFELKIEKDQVPKDWHRISVSFETGGRCNEGVNTCCDLYLDEIELN